MNSKLYLPSIKTFGQSLAYSLAVVLFILSGFLLKIADKFSHQTDALMSSILYKAFDKTTLWTLFYNFCLFLLYFILRLKLLEENSHSDLSGSGGIQKNDFKWLGIIGLISVLVASVVYISHFGLSELPFICGSVPSGVLLFRTVHLKFNDPDKNSDLPQQFIPKMFLPVFSSCSSAFLAGWGMLQPTPIDSAFYAAYLIVSTAIVCVGIGFIKMPTMAVIFTATSIVLAIIIQFFDGQTYGRAIIIALLLAFAAGFAEVGKRPFLVENKQVNLAKNEDANFYIAGANWSSILFLSLVPITALYSPVSLMPVLIAICPIMIIAWFSVSEPKSLLGHRVALTIGLGIPFLVSLLAFVSLYYNPKLPLAPINRVEGLATLNGIFLAILFGLYPEDFKLLHNNLYDKNTFLNRRSCAIFAAIIIALQTVIVPLVMFLFELFGKIDLDTPQRASMILIVALMASIGIFFILWLIPPRPSGPAGDQARLSDGSPADINAQAQPLMQSPSDAPYNFRQWFLKIRAIVILCRPLSSALAGFSCVGFGMGGHVQDPTSLLRLFVTGCLLGAFGFAVNDLFDRKKDLAGHRTDKVLISGALEVYQVGAICFVLLFAIIIASSALSLESRLVSISLAGLLGAYSAFARQFPILKGAYTAAMCCLLPFVGALDQGVNIPGWMVVTIFIYIIGREIFIDITEIDADKAAALGTIAVVLGRRTALPLALGVMVAACLLFAAFSPPTVVVASGAFVMLMCIAVSAKLISYDKNEWALQVTRIPMFMLLAMIGVSVSG